LPYNKAFDYITKFYTDPAAAKGKKKGNSATDEIDLTGSDDDLPSGEAEGMDELPGGSQANAVVDPIDLASGLPCE
jgi:DNA mismatch repair protein MSH3